MPTTMLTATRIALIVLMAVAALLALHLTAVAQRESVTPLVRFGALLTWWGGVALVVWLSVLAEAAVRRRVETQRQRGMDAALAASQFSADARWIRMALLFAVLLALMGFGLWVALLAHRIDMLIAALCMTPLLPFALMYARMVLRPGPMLSMDLRGIDHASIGFLPWSAVIGLQHDITSFRGRDQHMLALGVRDPWCYLDQCNGLVRWIKRAYRRERPRYGSFEITLHQLDRRPEEIVAAARQLRARAGGDFLEHWSRHQDDASVRSAFEMKQLIADMDAFPADASEPDFMAMGERVTRALDAQSTALKESVARARRGTRWMVVWLLLMVLLAAWQIWSRLR